MRNTCAFTGHRPEKLPWRRGETDEGCKRLKRALYNQIVRYANAGVTDYLSGMAEGVDTWAAQSVLLLRRQSSSIRLHCILPCTARGGSVECIGAGAVSVDFGAGGFHCLCSPELYRRLYAGAQPFSGGACRSSIGGLQWGSAGRYSGHCALCSKAGAGDLGAGPGNSSHRL